MLTYETILLPLITLILGHQFGSFPTALAANLREELLLSSVSCM